MNSLLKTIKSNWRDFIAFALIGLGLAMLSGAIDYFSARFGDNTFIRLVLPTLSNYLQGFSRFIGASLTATCLWMLLWPTISQFGAGRFTEGFDSLGVKGQFICYITLIGVALIAAAICFSV